MKKLKVNLMVAFTLLLGVMAMSFQAAKSSQGYDWYGVDELGNIPTAVPLTGGQPNTAECNASNQQTICAIEILLNPAYEFPETVSEASANHTTRGETKRDQ